MSTLGSAADIKLIVPSINLPQAAVLGMHAIKEKPVVVNGLIVIRPIMIVALTYDHRLLDGREAVTFLGQSISRRLIPLLMYVLTSRSPDQGVYRGPPENAAAFAGLRELRRKQIRIGVTSIGLSLLEMQHDLHENMSDRDLLHLCAMCLLVLQRTH